MKRLTVSIVMTLLALSIAVFSYFDVKRNSEIMVSGLNQAITALDNADADSLRESCERVIKVWNKCRGRFELYLYSEELFETDMNFRKIEKLSDGYDDGELKELIFENINNILRMADNQTPSLKKVF